MRPWPRGDGWTRRLDMTVAERHHCASRSARRRTGACGLLGRFRSGAMPSTRRPSTPGLLVDGVRPRSLRSADRRDRPRTVAGAVYWCAGGPAAESAGDDRRWPGQRRPRAPAAVRGQLRRRGLCDRRPPVRCSSTRPPNRWCRRSWPNVTSSRPTAVRGPLPRCPRSRWPHGRCRGRRVRVAVGRLDNAAQLSGLRGRSASIGLPAAAQAPVAARSSWCATSAKASGYLPGTGCCGSWWLRATNHDATRNEETPGRGNWVLTWGFWWSRLSESNRRPSHYEKERHCLLWPLPATLLAATPGTTRSGIRELTPVRTTTGTTNAAGASLWRRGRSCHGHR